MPLLRPFDLRFEDDTLESEFARDLVPRRRRVGTANDLGLLVVTAVIWVSQAFIVPVAAVRIAGPMHTWWLRDLRTA